MPQFNLYQYVPEAARKQAPAPFTVPEPENPFKEGSPTFSPGLPAFQAAFTPPSQAAQAITSQGLPTTAVDDLVAQGMSQSDAITTLIAALQALR